MIEVLYTIFNCRRRTSNQNCKETIFLTNEGKFSIRLVTHISREKRWPGVRKVIEITITGNDLTA